MSQDLKDAKRGTGSVYPEKAFDAGGTIPRVENLIDGKRLRENFLWGFPLVSPITKEKLTDLMLEGYIKRAFNQAELDTQVDFAPVLRRHRLPFDPNLYNQFIYCEIPNKPIQLVKRLAICSASYRETGDPNESSRYPSGAEIYTIPNDWIEMGNANRGILNVNPINPAFSAIGTNTAIGASGATILQFVGQQGWVPAYWTAEILHGFCTLDGKVPVVINEIIGQKAAMLLLQNLIPLYRFASQSLGIDSMSQSVNDLAYQLLQSKYAMIKEDYAASVKRIKMLTGNTMFSSNV